MKLKPMWRIPLSKTTISLHFNLMGNRRLWVSHIFPMSIYEGICWFFLQSHTLGVCSIDLLLSAKSSQICTSVTCLVLVWTASNCVLLYLSQLVGRSGLLVSFQDLSEFNNNNNFDQLFFLVGVTDFPGSERIRY